MTHLEFMRMEFSEEAATTKRVLDRIPADRLGWTPHEKSMTLGQLALHIATVPASIVRITQTTAFDVLQNSFEAPSPQSVEEIQTALERTRRTVEDMLRETSEETAAEGWHLVAGDRELLTMPRLNVWRSLMLNHWYHHRGQLSVYLRILNVAVPSIYGPSADESPFAKKAAA